MIDSDFVNKNLNISSPVFNNRLFSKEVCKHCHMAKQGQCCRMDRKLHSMLNMLKLTLLMLYGNHGNSLIYRGY